MSVKYAEDVGHYWKTGERAADTWMWMSKKIIKEIGGTIQADAFGSSGGRAAYMLQFEIKGQAYKVVWPVLPSRSGDERAAKIQAATMLFYDVKAKAMTASVLGPEVAFFSYALLQDGRIASEIALPELRQSWPILLTEGKG